MIAIEIGPPGSEEVSSEEAKLLLAKILKDTMQDGLGVVFHDQHGGVLTGHVLMIEEVHWPEAIEYARTVAEDLHWSAMSIVASGPFAGREAEFQRAVVSSLN